ncbi:MAG: response regulator [Pirellulaceae bacterium]
MQANGPRLLIADDDRDFRESLGEVFARRGFTTCLAADGCEALEIVRATRELHLVILDIHMPRLTGLQALEQIRQQRMGGQNQADSSLPQLSLPCILMSAQVDEAIVRQAEELETQVLSKPFTLRLVTETVEDMLHRSYGWRI